MNCNSRVGRKVEHLNSRWIQLGNARELIGPSFVQCHKATQNLDRNNKVYRNNKAYDNMADLCYRKLKIDDFININGKLCKNYEVELCEVEN